MSDDPIDESAGLGAADPITGVTGAKDDLDDDTQLPDSDEDFDAAVEEEVDGEGADLAADDPEAIRAGSMQTVTDDAVAGDTVDPGRGDGNDGPTGGAPTEAQAELPENDLDPSVDLRAQPIDLRDEV